MARFASAAAATHPWPGALPLSPEPRSPAPDTEGRDPDTEGRKWNGAALRPTCQESRGMIRKVVLAAALVLAGVMPAHARAHAPSGHHGHFAPSRGRAVPHHSRFAHFGIVPPVFVSPFGYLP